MGWRNSFYIFFPRQFNSWWPWGRQWNILDCWWSQSVENGDEEALLGHQKEYKSNIGTTKGIAGTALYAGYGPPAPCTTTKQWGLFRSNQKSERDLSWYKETQTTPEHLWRKILIGFHFKSTLTPGNGNGKIIVFTCSI